MRTPLQGTPSPHAIAGVVLAGGRSTRMGTEKAFVELDGRPLIARVLERFAPQVATLAINANGDPARFAAFGLRVLPDARDDGAGPLAGIAAGLAHARDAGATLLATVPCDAPFLPRDLVARLAAARGAGVALAAVAGGVEPLFGLWPVAALARVEEALRAGDLAVRKVAAAIGCVAVDIPAANGEPDWRLNLNTPGDIAAAGRG